MPWAAALAGLAGILFLVGRGRAQDQAPRPLGAPTETLQQAVDEAEAAARTSGMRMTVSAVGFDIRPDSAAARDLQAATSAGGGLYVPASQAGQLAGALRQALDGGAGPSTGARGRVALLPAPVVRGAAENGERVTAALGAVATGGGLGLLPAAEVASQVQGVNLGLPQALPRLVEWGRALKVDYVIYPRVLSVGKPFNAKEENERIITILVNVVHVKTGRMIHTSQVGSTYVDDTFPAESVAPPEVVAGAAEKLLAPFLGKLPGPSHGCGC